MIAFRNVVRGIDRALRLFAGLRRKQTSVPTLLRTATVDGLPGYVGIDRDDVLQTTALDVRDGRIVAIYIGRNPESFVIFRHLSKQPVFHIPAAEDRRLVANCRNS